MSPNILAKSFHNAASVRNNFLRNKSLQLVFYFSYFNLVNVDMFQYIEHLKTLLFSNASKGLCSKKSLKDIWLVALVIF